MITTFTSMKGGTGKTTITGLLANYVSKVLNKRVILIDIDPQGGCTTLFLGLEAREIIDGKGIAAWHFTCVYDERHRTLTSGDDHPTQSAQCKADRRIRWCGRDRHSGGRLHFQCPVLMS